MACYDVYSAEDVHPYTTLIWGSLRREVMEGGNKDVEEAALSALTALVRVLEVGPTTTASRAAVVTLIQAALNGKFPSSNFLSLFSILYVLVHFLLIKRSLAFRF